MRGAEMLYLSNWRNKVPCGESQMAHALTRI
jgi:hypothetical protein